MADSTRPKTSNGGCQGHLKNQKWWAPLTRKTHQNQIRWPSVASTKLKIPHWWVLLSQNIALRVCSFSAKNTHVMGTINLKPPKYWTPKSKNNQVVGTMPGRVSAHRLLHLSAFFLKHHLAPVQQAAQWGTLYLSVVYKDVMKQKII